MAIAKPTRADGMKTFQERTQRDQSKIEEIILEIEQAIVNNPDIDFYVLFNLTYVQKQLLEKEGFVLREICEDEYEEYFTEYALFKEDSKYSDIHDINSIHRIYW